MHAWEGMTRALITTNSKLFVTSLQGVISTIVNNGMQDGRAIDDKKLILQIKVFLEELTDG